jgi:hypothetical protein
MAAIRALAPLARAEPIVDRGKRSGRTLSWQEALVELEERRQRAEALLLRLSGSEPW